ncbi:MAG: hypothetical protein E7426_01055 [Ruminococcaceae bacterium]|nr:hypothetical protein [Oscillospiraceae bacterium]
MKQGLGILLTLALLLSTVPGTAIMAFYRVNSGRAYYPKGDSTWMASVRQSYGGMLTWVAYWQAENTSHMFT